MFVESGGSSFEPVASSGGNIYLFGGEDIEGLIATGGTEHVEAGGFAFQTFISLGGQVVDAGGFADSAIVVSSVQLVENGGFGVSTFIETLGTMEVAAGGSTDGTAVFFEGSNGLLRLDDSQHFTTPISGLDASPGVGADTNYIDLKDIVYGAGTHFSWSSAGGGSGTLTVTDGTHTAHLELLGNYTAADFKIANDGTGGTFVFDPANSAQLGSVATPTHT